MNKKYLRIMVSLLIMASMLSGVMLASAQSDANIVRVAIMGSDDIPTIDPSLAEDVSGIQAIEMLFPGLTSLNESTVQVEPGIASDWEISEDGLTYTFNIMPEIPWVQYDTEAGEVVQVLDDNGEPRYVTAADVVYGWQRSLNPETLSYYGEVLSKWVVGGEDLIDLDPEADGFSDALAEASANLGISEIDEYTVQITAPGNFAFLPNIYGMWMARPLPSWTIEANGDFWTEPENINTYGPFALKEWQNDQSITFIRNPFWEGTEAIPAPQLDEVVNFFLEESAALANYEAGELEYVNPVDQAQLDRVRVEYEGQYSSGPGTCTYYYGFNLEKAPFDNVNARRAFSLAIDRDAITTNVTNAGEVPAAFFTRPDMVAAPSQRDYAEVELLITNDDDARIEAAQEAWQTYLDESGVDPADLAITLVYNDTETHARIGEAIQAMWVDVLGVEVELNAQEWSTFLDIRASDAPQIFRAAWCYDYPDAHNWTFDVFRSDSGQADDGGNEVNWVNETFDELITQAASEPDVEVRRELYGQAEVIMAWEDVAIAPIYYYANPLLLSPSIDAPFSQTGIERFEKWSFN